MPGISVRCEGLRVTRGDKTILNDVSIAFPRGDFVAVMGASGAGKTTFLNSLMGRPGMGATFSGKVLFDTLDMNAASIEERDALRKRTGYVTQDDIMFNTLTPREQIRFRLLNVGVDSATVDARADSVLTRLGLTKCADTVVGNPSSAAIGGEGGVSGGERKRVNVALSLCSDPDLLLLDEPTSGLDSRKAKSLIEDLKWNKGKITVISTIHQPSAATFELFTSVFLLDNGDAVFYGTVAELVSALATIGAPVPEHGNPAEHVMEVLEIMPEKVELLKQMYTGNGSSSLVAVAEAAAITAEDTTLSSPAAAATPSTATPAAANRESVFLILFRRNFQCVKREPFLTKIRFAQSVLTGLLIGCLFFDLDRNVVGVRNRAAVCFLLCLTQFLFSTLGMLNVFIGERPVFLREALDRLYTPFQFWLAKVLLDVPLQAFFAVLTTTICYFMIGLNKDSPGNFFLAAFVIVLLANAGSSLGFIISAKMGTIDRALALTPAVILPQVLLSGFMIDVESMPIPFRGLSYVAFFRYAWQALTLNEFDCAQPDASCLATGVVTVGTAGTTSALPPGWSVMGLPNVHADAKACANSPCPFCCDSRELVGELGICPVTTCDGALQQLGLTDGDVWPEGDSVNAMAMHSVYMLIGITVLARLLSLLVLQVEYRKIERGAATRAVAGEGGGARPAANASAAVAGDADKTKTIAGENSDGHGREGEAV